MRIPKFKSIILLLLLIALIVPALTFAQEEVDEEDTPNEEHPCNTLVLGLLVQIGRSNECDYFLLLEVGPGQFKHAANYFSVEVSIETILDWRGGDDPIGWGQIKQAKALSESDIGYEGSFKEAVIVLSESGWGEIKNEFGYTGPPPWAKGGGKSEEDLQEAEGEGKKFDGDNEGPPYGKAKGHGKNKDKGK